MCDIMTPKGEEEIQHYALKSGITNVNVHQIDQKENHLLNEDLLKKTYEHLYWVWNGSALWRVESTCMINQSCLDCGSEAKDGSDNSMVVDEGEQDFTNPIDRRKFNLEDDQASLKLKDSNEETDAEALQVGDYHFF
ncbi:hypothetical protein Tco_0057842 [Tanacetum coccineum]